MQNYILANSFPDTYLYKYNKLRAYSLCQIQEKCIFLDPTQGISSKFVFLYKNVSGKDIFGVTYYVKQNFGFPCQNAQSSRVKLALHLLVW